MCIVVVGNEHQWCPDCIFTIKSWRVHVIEEHLSGPKRKPEEVASNELQNHMDYLNEKTGELITVPRQGKLVG